MKLKKILELAINSHKHRIADYLNHHTKQMVLDAIALGLLMNSNYSIDDFNVEFNENSIDLQQKAHYDKTNPLKNPLHK